MRSLLLDELFASAPKGRYYYITLEFNHPSFRTEGTNEHTSIRLVQGFEPLSARIEAGAPFGAGQYVTFQPAAFDVELPTKGVSGEHSMNINIDGASAEITRQLERVATGVRAPIQVIFREFVSTDLSMPQSTPIKMTVLNPSVNGNRVSAQASYSDLLNKAYPSIKYTLNTHPGLA